MIDIDELYAAVTAAYEDFDDVGVKKELRDALAETWDDGRQAEFEFQKTDPADLAGLTLDDLFALGTDNPYREES